MKEVSFLEDKLQKNQNVILPADYVRTNHKWNEVFFPPTSSSNIRELELNTEIEVYVKSYWFQSLNRRNLVSQEFNDSIDNTNWTYNCTILKMMADLNSKTLVTLGDSRHKACLLFSRNRVGLDGNCLSGD